MNKFNDIITEDKVLEIPQYINSISDYGPIIEKAFALTGGLLSLDEFNVEEDGRHIRILLTSKNTQTKFKLNSLNNNQIDQKDLIRGLNRALTDIFYLGDERFYSINGKVVSFGIGFISNRQKRHLLKAGLIGDIDFKINRPEREVKEITKSGLKNEEFSERKINKHLETIKDTLPNRKELNEIPERFRYLEIKLNNKNSLEIFDIIHHPQNYNFDTLKVARKIAKERKIPILSLGEYEILLEKNNDIIKRVVKLLQENEKGSVHQILEESDLDRTGKFVVLSEVQRKAKKKKPSWKIIIKIILIIIAILMFLARL